MTNVNGIQPVFSPKAVESTDAVAATSPKVGFERITDVVDISTASILAAKARELPPVRSDLVAKVRSEIAEGTYETQERLDATVDRLMEELFPQMM